MSRGFIKFILKRLFPKMGFIYRTNYISNNSSKYDANLLICSENHFKTYFKLESICPDVPLQYHTELAEKYYDNKHIDYHMEFFRAGLNAIIKKWLNNSCKETPEEINDIITSEYRNKS